MKYHRHLLNSCVEALNGIFFENRHADKCIEYYLRNNKKWGSRDRRFFAETVYDCVRWWTLYWYLLDESPQAGKISILAPSLWQRNMDLPEIDEFSGVNYNVFEKRFVQLKDAATRAAFPGWLFDFIHQQLGDEWLKTVTYYNRPNQLVLRVNRQKSDCKQVIEKLGKENIFAEKLLGTSKGLIIAKRANVFKTPLFKKGYFEVQDGSSQQVAEFLQVQPGQRVIDACAGAGGKTLHIADLLQNRGKVVALDIHQWKLDQLKLRARRNSYSNIEIKVIESSKTVKRLKETADRLLLDVPCTGLGVLRRNPDTKWKLTKKSIEELVILQEQILQQYSQMLKVGGQMVYATCSVLPQENQEQVIKFLNKNSQFKLIKQKTIYPCQDGFDGFFMALMQKV